MARVTWHPSATDDLLEIANFIARDSRIFARAFSNRLYNAAGRLSDFPRSGRVFPELGREDVREIVVGRYRIVHQLMDDTVRVIAVVHSARSINPGDLPLDEPVA